jgi:hypothetical protein
MIKLKYKMQNNQLRVTQITNLLNEIKQELSIEDIKNIEEFIQNNEFGLAYETLCCQIYEHETPISCEFYEKISFYGTLIELQPSIWLPLKELIST